MYIKKVDGPRIVTLPNGKTLSRADLPCRKTVRWVASRKATVARAVVYGLMTKEEAVERWSLSEDELDSWIRALDRHGEEALKTTALQKYREG